MRNSHSSRDRFADDHEALDFIASRIADEAERERVSLSEVERKMLYFSETAWTLPDIWQVSDEFDRDYKQDDYERKISQLIKKAVAHARKQQRVEFDGWTAAIRRLSEGDRYLLVMVKQAGVGRAGRSARFPFNWWRLAVVGVIVAALFAGFTWILATIHPLPGGYMARSGRYASPISEAITFSVWAFPVCVLLVYFLLSLILGAGKVNAVTNQSFEWIFGRSRRRK
jgi:hypothetical protein